MLLYRNIYVTLVLRKNRCGTNGLQVAKGISHKTDFANEGSVWGWVGGGGVWAEMAGGRGHLIQRNAQTGMSMPLRHGDGRGAATLPCVRVYLAASYDVVATAEGVANLSGPAGRVPSPTGSSQLDGVRRYGLLIEFATLSERRHNLAFESQLKVQTRNAQGSAAGQIPGRLSGIQLGIPAAPGQDLAVSYRYDTFGRFDQVTGPTGEYTYSRTSNSDLLAGLVSPVHTVAQTYEPQRDLVDLRSNQAGSTVLSSFDYLNDPLGRRVQRAHAGAVFGPGSTYIYGYNASSEVVGVTNAAASSRARSYVYNEIGNRRNYVPSSNPPNTPLQHTYLANALNQYTSISASWVSQSPTYDLDGNQTFGRFNSSAPNLGLSWDAENRLITSEAHELRRVTNSYDAFGRRGRRSVLTCGTSTWSLIKDEKFIYNGWKVVAVLNAVPKALPILRIHVWGLDLSATRQGAGGIGGLLGVKDGVATCHYLYGARGNVSEILNATVAGVAHYEYDAFGLTTVATGSYSQVNEYRFSTKPFESQTGLYYYGFRYYNPSTGRRLNRDPIEENVGLNLYGMVNNDPVNYWDYLGFTPECKPDCSKIKDEIDLLNSQFNDKSDALRDDLQFQYDEARTLFGIDRAIDIASQVTGGSIGSFVRRGVMARAAVTASGGLASKIAQSGLMGKGKITLFGKGMHATEGWVKFGVYGTISGGVVKKSIDKASRGGPSGVRDRIQETVASADAYLDDLVAKLRELREEYINCRDS